MKKGFTLIELLVVVLIIGILSAVALPQYTKAVEKSRATQAMTLVKSVADAQKIYYLANGKYTDKFEDLDIGIPGNPTGPFIKLKDFQLTLVEMNTKPRVEAFYTRQEQQSSWYIVFHLAEDKNRLVCSAATSNVHGNSFCKSFSTRIVPCEMSGYTCYAI